MKILSVTESIEIQKNEMQEHRPLFGKRTAIKMCYNFSSLFSARTVQITVFENCM